GTPARGAGAPVGGAARGLPHARVPRHAVQGHRGCRRRAGEHGQEPHAVRAREAAPRARRVQGHGEGNAMSGRGRDGGGEAPEAQSGEDLVALLYGELDADQAARTGAQVESDPAQAARFDEMRRVRELFSAMEDEEPPSRLTAQLMAEAARSAPQARAAAIPAEAGMWARFVSWLQPLVQRPALAAAASLVLVGGVAGVLYMRKGEELTSTTPASTPVSEATPPAAATGSESAAERAPTREVARRKQAPGGQAASGKKAMSYDKTPAKPTVKSGTVLGLSEQEMVPREEQAAGGGAAPAEQKKADDAPMAEPAPAPQAPP